MKDKPVVGQKMFMLNIGNLARNTDQKLVEMVVTKVGRLYFTVKLSPELHWREQFRLSDWTQKTDCSRGYQIFATAKEWEDLKKSTDICKDVSATFLYGRNNKRLSLEQLERIKAILDEVNP